MGPATDSGADIIDRLESAMSPEEVEEQPLEQPEVEEPETIDEDAEATQDDDVEEVVEEVEDEEFNVTQLFGVDEDRTKIVDGELFVETVVDGAKEWVKSSELVKDYQLAKHTTQKSMELAEQRKSWEAQAQQAQQAMVAKFQEAQQLATFLEQQVLSEFQGIDWNQMERDDPTQFVIQRQKFAERAQAIENSKTAVTAQQQEITQRQQAEMQQQEQAFLQAEMTQAIADYPAWQDATVMQKDIDSIKSGMLEYGYTSDDFAGVTDHRQIAILRDALAYRAGKQAVTAKKAKKSVPKFQQPGRKREANASARKSKQAKMAKLKRSGSPKDGIDLLMDII